MELLLDPSLPARLTELALGQRGVLTTAQLRAAGLGSSRVHDVGRRDGWRELLQGTRLVAVHTGDDAERDLMRSWNQAARLVLPEAVLGLDSALVELGVAVPWRDGVSVVVPPGRELRRRPGMDAHVWQLARGDVVALSGLRMTRPVRSLSDLVPRLDRPTALSALDSARRRGAVSAAGLVEARELARGRPGCRRVDDLWALADPRAESPLESRVRLRMIDGRLAPDELQERLRGRDGAVVARPDLTIARERRRRPERGPLYVEADGRGPHGAPIAVYRDRERASAVLGLDGDVERFTWRDTFDPMLIPWRLRRSL